MTLALDRIAVSQALEAAIRAPSMHNAQPWRFRVDGNAILVLADPSRGLPVADPGGWATRIACGAAAQNLQLALAALERESHVRWRPDPQRWDIMARVEVGSARSATDDDRRLYAAIFRRHSNRRPFDSEPVPSSARLALISSVGGGPAWLDLLTGALPVGLVGEIARAADRVLRRSRDYEVEVAAWTRQDSAHPDGVPSDAGTGAAGSNELFPRRPFGTGALDAVPADVEPEPLVGVLGTPGDTVVDQLVAGAALQRVLLTATDLGLAASMISQPIEVPSARDQLRAAVGRHGIPQMVLRLGYGQPSGLTPRRPVDQVVDGGYGDPGLVE